jgi:hypothetical protein
LFDLPILYTASLATSFKPTSPGTTQLRIRSLGRGRCVLKQDLRQFDWD